MIGLALYSKSKTMYAFEVAYEYGDTRFVGFRSKEKPYMGNCYKIVPITGYVKVKLSIGDNWYINKEKNKLVQKREDGKIIATMPDYKERLNTEDLLRIEVALKRKYYVFQFEPKSRYNIPVGKKYTQLPGGGGGYKVSRKFTNPLDMVKNKTIIKILDKFYALNEIRMAVKNQISLILENKTRKKKKTHVDFIGAVVEDENEIKKINAIVDKIDIPDGWKIPADYHMTITKDSGEKKMRFRDRKRIVNKSVDLKITAIGFSNDAIALKEDGNMWSRKDTKHITIAYKNSPQDSDKIINWKKLPSPVIIRAIIRQIGYDKKTIFDIDLDEPETQIDERSSQVTAGNFQSYGAASGASRIFPKFGKEYKS